MGRTAGRARATGEARATSPGAEGPRRARIRGQGPGAAATPSRRRGREEIKTRLEEGEGKGAEGLEKRAVEAPELGGGDRKEEKLEKEGEGEQSPGRPARAAQGWRDGAVAAGRTEASETCAGKHGPPRRDRSGEPGRPPRCRGPGERDVQQRPAGSGARAQSPQLCRP